MPQKKIKKNRLNKRQVEYLKQFNIFVNAKDDDPFYKEKKEVAQALKELNEKINEYNPEVDPEVNPEGNQEENPKVEEKKKLTKDEAGVLSGLYLNAINKMNAYSDKVEASINEEKKAEDKAGKKAEGKEKQKNKKDYKQILAQNDVLTGLLGKDFEAFNKASEDDNEYTIDEIYDKSRVDSSFMVDPDEVKEKVGGALSERIPVTLIKGDKKIKGYFTPDTTVKSEETSQQEAYIKISEKYGKMADFMDFDTLKSISKNILSNKSLYQILATSKNFFHYLNYEEQYRLFALNLPAEQKQYFNTQEKMRVMIDVLGEFAKIANASSIDKNVGIKKGRNVNRRNAAMSSVAEVLGCSNLIAHSENVSIKLDGTNETKGTFMLEAKGTDCMKADPNSETLKLGAGSCDKVSLKKQIADLQALDYICGNPDRHGGNVLYKIGKGNNNRLFILGIQGIDNDTSFGTGIYKNVRLNSVQLDMMNVITKDMAERIMNLTPDKLKQVLYGKKLTKKEIDRATERLKQFQKKLIDDQKEYAKGYKKGYLLPGRIKIVDDQELSELRMEDLSKTPHPKKHNLFSRVNAYSNIMNSIKCIDENFEKEYRNSIYDATIDSLGDLTRLIDKMDADYGSIFSSSKPYNTMLGNLKQLKSSILKLKGPLVGKNAEIINDHVKQIKDIKVLMTDTLKSVNEYRYYKYNKQSGEEWRDTVGQEGHEVTRTERRFHHSTEALELLSKYMVKFEKVDNVRNDYAKFIQRQQAIENEGKIRKNEYNNLIKPRINSIVSENLIDNHLGRCEYEIMEAYENLKNNKNPEKQDELRLIYDMNLGLAINSLKPAYRRDFKRKIEMKTGEKITESNEILIARGVTSQFVLTKIAVSAKLKDDRDVDEEKIFTDLKNLDVSKPLSAVNGLLKNNAYIDAFNKNTKMLIVDIVKDGPGVKLISNEDMMALADSFKKQMAGLKKQNNVKNVDMIKK